MEKVFWGEPNPYKNTNFDQLPNLPILPHFSETEVSSAITFFFLFILCFCIDYSYHMLVIVDCCLRQVTTKPILIYPNSGESYDAQLKQWVVSITVLDLYKTLDFMYTMKC